jgi:hypothetical protein
VLELDEQSALYEQSAVDGQEPEFLDLATASIVDDDAVVLDLGEESIVGDDGGILDLSDEAVAAADEEPVTGADLEAGEETVSMLDLGEDSVVTEDAVTSAADEPADLYEAGVLELGEESVADEVADTREALETSPHVPDAETGPQEVLARAFELRDIIARATSHDPAARAAVDELYDLIRNALG